MNIWLDLKYAWRLALSSPGHSLLCSATVALSVALATLAYELAHSQAWRPLPYAGSDRWLSVQVAANETARLSQNIDAYTYQELLAGATTADHLGAFSIRAAVLSEQRSSTSLRGGELSPRLLSAMNVAPRLGRIFEEAEGLPGAARVVILSFDTWQNYFAADPAIIGKEARIDGGPVQIIGVMPEDFFAFEDFAIFRPLILPKLTAPSDSTVFLSALVRLKEGQNEAALSAEMKVAVDEVNRRHPERFHAGRHVELIPARLISSYNNLEIVAVCNFIALAVMLLGCVNIGLIFFARLLERSRELAVRTALGSSRGRLLRQCLLESFVVVLLGLLVGFVLVSLGVRWMEGVAETQTRVLAVGRSPGDPSLRVDIFMAAVLAAIVLWLISTLVPAWRIAKQDAAAVLAGGSKGTAGPAGAKMVCALVGIQVTIACLVLVICGNLVFAVDEEVSQPTGLDSTRVIISTYPTVFDARYSAAGERLRYWDELRAAILARAPGARVAYSTSAPARPGSMPVAIEDREAGVAGGALTLPVTAVSEDYFDMLGMKVRSGRLFDSTDGDVSLQVAVVDENTARRYWPDQDVAGKRIQLNPTENGPWLTIVGTVSAVAGRPYRRDVGGFYRPLVQAAPSSFLLVVKAPSAAPDFRALLRGAAFEVDRDLPLHNLQYLEEYLAALNFGYGALVPVFMMIGLVTVLLAATGVFGLISRSVARRTQEIGIRRALGGTEWQVSAVFLKQGTWYSVFGVAGGVLGILVANLISASVPNILVRAGPITFGVLVLMAAVIFLASYVPTRRAVALEPGDALRYE